MGKSMKTTASSSSASKPKSAASAKRASVACVSCKTRRTRCVKPEGQKVCVYCARHSLECVMTEDERKRSTSKAYLDSLRNRIVLLEEMLRKSGTEPPPMEQMPDKSADGSSKQRSNSPSSQSPSQNHQATCCPGGREQSPLEFKPNLSFLDGMASPSPRQLHSPLPEVSETYSRHSADWSLVSAASSSASSPSSYKKLPSLPSLSSGEAEDEASYAPMDYVSSRLLELDDGSVGKGASSMQWGPSLESGEAWEGQAALMDMGFMLGLGAEEVLAVQNGMKGVVGAEEVYSYGNLLHEVEFKLA